MCHLCQQMLLIGLYLCSGAFWLFPRREPDMVGSLHQFDAFCEVHGVACTGIQRVVMRFDGLRQEGNGWMEPVEEIEE